MVNCVKLAFPLFSLKKQGFFVFQAVWLCRGNDKNYSFFVYIQLLVTQGVA